MRIRRGNETVADVFVKDSSYTREEVNGEFVAFIEFDVYTPTEFAVNDYIEYMGNVYYVRYKESVTKEETSLGYSYRMMLYHELYRMHDVAFFLYDTPDFRKNMSYYTGNAEQVAGLIVKSMNRVYRGWSLGSVLETKAVTFDFKDKSCAEVLQDLLNTYETEYWVEGRMLYVGRRELSGNGLVLSQGAGFRSLTLSAVDDTPPITRVYAYGGDANIDARVYGSDYLNLPGGKRFVERNVDKYGVVEHVKQFEDVYPHGVFTVTEKIDDFTLCASGIDFDLNSHLIDDVEVIVTFQDGGLAGYDLAIVDGSWKNDIKRFKLAKNSEENALEVPGDIHFEVGDRFILTGLKMPQSYVDNAEQVLLEEANKWLDERCENRVQLQASCDEIYFAENDVFVSCGQMIGVFDAKLNIDREIRVTAVKHYIENDDWKPYRYDLTISDFLQGGGLSRIVSEVRETQGMIGRESSKNKQYTKRRWQDVIETQRELEREMLEGFTNSISPLTVHAMQGFFGSEQLQFVFVNSRTEPQYEVANVPQFDPSTGMLICGNAIMKHQTLGIDSLAPSHKASEYRYWDIPQLVYHVVEADGLLRLYVDCEREGSTGRYVVSKDPIDMRKEGDRYFFLMGYFTSSFDGARSWSQLYGFTEVLPGQVTANRFLSADGKSLIVDALSTIFNIGSESSGFSFNYDKPDGLVVRGGFVQRPGGIIAPIGCFMGVYNGATSYFDGDEVTFQGSMYRYTYGRPSSGVPPTNEAYWTLIAQRGEMSFTWIRYADDAQGGGMSDNPMGKMYIGLAHNKTSQVESDVPGDYQWALISGEQGVQGPPGVNGETLYTWIKYSDVATGSPMYDFPRDSTAYIGLATNKPTATEGTNPAEYTWSRFKGDQGVPGQSGNYTSFVFRQGAERPPTPSGANPVPDGWMDAPSTVTVSIDSGWTLLPDGTRQSPKVADSGYSLSRVKFTSASDNMRIFVYLRVSSESGFDCAQVGLLDRTDMSRGVNYTAMISGETEKIISVEVPTAGSHFVYVGYFKDSSVDKGQDCCWYRVMTDLPWWMSKSVVSWNGSAWSAGVWSVPVKTTGEDGEPGADGKYWDYRYKVAASKPATPTVLNPSDWYNAPPAVVSGSFLWMTVCEKDAGGTALLSAWSVPVRISGEKGEQGATGDFTERRYAKNGSRTAPPTLDRTAVVPVGWSTAMPVLGSLQYMWFTDAIKSADGKLKPNSYWGEPARLTGYDGQDGAAGEVGPSLLFRGAYSSSAIYYGTKKRVDAVKYGSTYYVARVDAGGFSGRTPPNASYWNDFESQVESIATGLLLAESAYVENLIVGRLSSGKEDSLPRLVAKGSEVGFYLNKSAESSTTNALVRIGTDVGSMQEKGQRPGILVREINGRKSAELTSAGLYANGGKITGLAATSGVKNAFSIAGVLEDRVEGESGIPGINAAVFGLDQTSTNYNYRPTGTYPNDIPALGFGGYFNKLRADGLFVRCRNLDEYSEENPKDKKGRVIDENDVFISMYNKSNTRIFLKLPQTEGQIFFVRVNNAPVEIDAYYYTGRSGMILLTNGSKVDRKYASTQGELVTLVWDGSYWLWNTTVQ